MFSIWATTRHYSDCEAQVKVLLSQTDEDGAERFLIDLFTRLLRPGD